MPLETSERERELIRLIYGRVDQLLSRRVRTRGILKGAALCTLFDIREAVRELTGSPLAESLIGDLTEAEPEPPPSSS